MFVGLSAVCCALTARLSLEHDGSWRLVSSKSCQRSAPTAAVCCLHWIKTKVAQSAVAGHSCYFGAQWSSQKRPTGKKRKDTKRDPSVVRTLRWGTIAEKNSADVGRGSTVGCLQFVFQLIPRPPSKGRDGQLWDEPDERTVCIALRGFKTSRILGKFETKCFYLYVPEPALFIEDGGFTSSKKRNLFDMIAFRVEWLLKYN